MSSRFLSSSLHHYTMAVSWNGDQFYEEKKIQLYSLKNLNYMCSINKSTFKEIVLSTLI
jgi:hypothetical protein